MLRPHLRMPHPRNILLRHNRLLNNTYQPLSCRRHPRNALPHSSAASPHTRSASDLGCNPLHLSYTWQEYP